MNQFVDIVKFMIRYGGITNKQAGVIGVGRLSGRIYDMRYAGIRIDTIRIPVKSRHGKMTTVAKYVFHSAESERLAVERYVAA